MPKLSASAWRHRQRLGPLDPNEPGTEGDPAGTRRQDERDPVEDIGGGTALSASYASIRRAIDELRAQTEERFSAVDEAIAEVARSMSRARWNASPPGRDLHGEAAEAAVSDRLRALEAHLTRVTQALTATDSRSRDVLSAIAQELVNVADQQHELRRELHRLVARIVGRPVL